MNVESCFQRSLSCFGSLSQELPIRHLIHVVKLKMSDFGMETSSRLHLLIYSRVQQSKITLMVVNGEEEGGQF